MTGNERTMIVIQLQSAGMMAPFGSYQNVSPDLVMPESLIEVTIVADVNVGANNAAAGADLDAARASAKQSKQQRAPVSSSRRSVMGRIIWLISLLRPTISRTTSSSMIWMVWMWTKSIGKSIHPGEMGEGGHSDSRTAKEKTRQRRRLRNTCGEEMAETGRTNIRCESQTHETKEGEHSEAELEYSPQYDECGDLEPAAPVNVRNTVFLSLQVAVGKPERKFSGRALMMKMESGSANNRRAGIRAGDEVRRDPRVIPEEGPRIRAGHWLREQKARRNPRGLMAVEIRREIKWIPLDNQLVGIQWTFHIKGELEANK
ncbi:hypothetical protein C8J57DRAFT_1242849 [Mycena rebaudengoi]|nr:hypothetical protein C8J57DRAFT_1242849 [Mycena rebaudengoi]